MQAALRRRAMDGGVTMTAPETVFLCADTAFATDVTVGPNVVFGPGVRIEAGVDIRPFCHLEGCTVGAGAVIGPFARLRPGSVIGEEAHVGNFVELKATTLGRGAKANHLSYLGDATIGERSNIGAGTITCNYDGFAKNRTSIGNHVFVGSDAVLVAPVSIGDGAFIAAGSVITEPVAADAMAFGRARQTEKPGRAADVPRPSTQDKGVSLMCGIVGVIGTKPAAPLILRGVAAVGVPRLRQRRHRHPGERPHRAAPRRGQAVQPDGACSTACRWPAPPASATPAGPPTARRPRATRIRTAPRASPSSTTASSRTTPSCAPSWSARARSSPPRPTPRRWRSWSTSTSSAACRRSRPRGAALRRLEGAYALAMVFAGHSELMIGARHGAPLAVGFGEDEMFLGSDALALAPLTRAHRLPRRRRLGRPEPHRRHVPRRRRRRGGARDQAHLR